MSHRRDYERCWLRDDSANRCGRGGYLARSMTPEVLVGWLEGLKLCILPPDGECSLFTLMLHASGTSREGRRGERSPSGQHGREK